MTLEVVTSFLQIPRSYNFISDCHLSLNFLGVERSLFHIVIAYTTPDASIEIYNNKFKVKKYKKTSRATSALDTSVVLESVLI